MVCNIFHVVDLICLNGNGMVPNQANDSEKKIHYGTCGWNCEFLIGPKVWMCLCLVFFPQKYMYHFIGEC